MSRIPLPTDDPREALAAIMVEISEAFETDENPNERLLEIAKAYAEVTHPFDRPISGLHRWH